ncbi:hypothetical protein [Alloscardovia omnicolens]|uniref:hypothetical protein n=1 Tax=Alloscardovia omnicolens TaxID=419015 RepID=UPI003A671E9D
MTNDNHNNPTDDTWEDFINAHSDDLKSLEKSRTAKKFEKKASKIDEQVKKRPILRIENFNDDIFTDHHSVPRGYSTSWLDADDDHFHAPTPQWSSVALSSILAALFIIAGFASIFLAVAFPIISRIGGIIGGICLILGCGIFITMHKSRTNSSSNRHNDGARV